MGWFHPDRFQTGVSLAALLLVGACASDIPPCERAEWSADMLAWIRAEAAKPHADASRWLRWEREYQIEFDRAAAMCRRTRG